MEDVRKIMQKEVPTCLPSVIGFAARCVLLEQRCATLQGGGSCPACAACTSARSLTTHPCVTRPGCLQCYWAQRPPLVTRLWLCIGVCGWRWIRPSANNGAFNGSNNGACKHVWEQARAWLIAAGLGRQHLAPPWTWLMDETRSTSMLCPTAGPLGRTALPRESAGGTRRLRGMAATAALPHCRRHTADLACCCWSGRALLLLQHGRVQAGCKARGVRVKG